MVLLLSPFAAACETHALQNLPDGRFDRSHLGLSDERLHELALPIVKEQGRQRSAPLRIDSVDELVVVLRIPEICGTRNAALLQEFGRRRRLLRIVRGYR